ARKLDPSLFFTMATPEQARALGDVTTVPALFVFGPDGRTAMVRYGATPELQSEVEAAVERLLPR
ncbi:MAG TPA: hypothetical protein VN923_05500, partial [Thermoanaerobaculia bacterium]|nr:hypothetical protein [Thermoanaerobaculia bacterium]